MRAYISRSIGIAQAPNAVAELEFLIAMNANHRMVYSAEKLAAAYLTVCSAFRVLVTARRIHLLLGS
jgi:hypothetical protein